MSVGWLQDNPGYIGGAELTCQEFRAAAPVEIVDCPPGGVVEGLEHYVAHNVVHYRIDDMPLGNTTWFHHDLSPDIQPDVQAYLDHHASHIFCSPLQREKYGIDGKCIPPALDLDAYKPTRQTKRHRKGTCSIAQWRNPGKGAQAILEYAAANGRVDVYGDGGFAPHGRDLENMGPIAPADVAQTLWGYETFVFLPFEIEPFCRTVAEAHYAGCKVVTNRLIGANYWLEHPEALHTAARDFWLEVLG